MAEKNRVTKKMVLEAVRKVAEDGVDFGAEVTTDDVIAYVDTTIAQLDAKNAKAKERAAEKKADGDALRTAVKAVLTDELQTIDEITTKVVATGEFEDLTKSKVTARLTQLKKAGEIYNADVKVDTRKVKGYALEATPIINED